MSEQREGRHSSTEKGLYPRSNRWEDWLKTYDEASDIDARISQLHYGLRTNNRTAAIIFYLTEAEGHTGFDYNFFLLDSEKNRNDRTETLFGSFDSIAEARRQIAKTAFGQIMLHVFKDTRDKRCQEIPSWLPYLRRPDILDAVLHFFRIDEANQFVNLFGLEESSPYQALAVEFLETLAAYGWKRIPGGRYYDDEAEKLFSSRRDKLIDILCGLGKLDTLLHIDGIEKEVLKKLERLALKKAYWLYCVKKGGETHRRPANIDEASFAGSQAANILILLRNKLEVAARFEATQEARQRREKANRELEKLTK